MNQVLYPYGWAKGVVMTNNPRRQLQQQNWTYPHLPPGFTIGWRYSAVRLKEYYSHRLVLFFFTWLPLPSRQPSGVMFTYNAMTVLQGRRSFFLRLGPPGPLATCKPRSVTSTPKHSLYYPLLPPLPNHEPMFTSLHHFVCQCCLFYRFVCLLIWIGE